MTDHIEEYMARSAKSTQPKKKKKIDPIMGEETEEEEDIPSEIPDIDLRDYPPNIKAVEVYHKQCSALQTAPDAFVERTLGKLTVHDVVELDFSTSFMSKESFIPVAAVLKACSNIRFIDLSSTNLKEETVLLLCELILELPKLQTMYLSDNPRLGFNSAQELLAVIKSNPSICSVNVDGTNMSSTTVDLLNKHLYRNNEVRLKNEEEEKERKMQEEYERLQAKPVSPSNVSLMGASLLEDSQMEDDPLMVSAGLIGSGIPDGQEDELLTGQKATNVKLVNQLNRHEKALLDFNRDLVDTVDSYGEEIKVRQAKGHEYLHDIQDGWKYTEEAVYRLQDLVDDCHLNVNEVDLQEFNTIYTPAIVQKELNIQGFLTEIIAPSTSRRRKEKLMGELKPIVEGHGPHHPEVLECLDSLYDQMHLEATSITALHRKLNETAEQIGDLRNRVEKAENTRQTAIANEDLKQAEKEYLVILNCLEKLMDLVKHRLDYLAKGSKSHILYELSKTATRATELIKEQGETSEDVAAKIEKDLKLIDAHMKQAVVKQQDTETQCAQRMEEYWKVLLENREQQTTMWKAVTSQMRDIRKLAEERITFFGGFVTEKQKLERSKIETAGILSVCEQHIDTLHRLLNDAKAANTLVRPYQDYVDKSCITVKRNLQEVTEEGDALAHAEHIAYLELFRKFYLATSDLTLKKEKRLEELDRVQRTLEYQIRFAHEALDPEVNDHRDRLRELTGKKKELEKQLDSLRTRGLARVEEYRPLEDLLKATGHDFVSPLIEGEELNVERRTKILESRKTVQDRDRLMLVDKEQAMLQHLKTMTRQARESGVATLVHSLSAPTPPLMDSRPASSASASFAGSLSAEMVRPSSRGVAGLVTS